MKGLITKIFAALLVGWYMMSIIGFGVHTCSGSGKSFVVAFYEEMTCEEIHPAISATEYVYLQNLAAQMIIRFLS